MSTAEQMQKMKNQPGFIAALDQSGGSTPHALVLYGIKDHSWKDDDEMFELVHQMRARVITSLSCAVGGKDYRISRGISCWGGSGLHYKP